MTALEPINAASSAPASRLNPPRDILLCKSGGKLGSAKTLGA